MFHAIWDKIVLKNNLLCTWNLNLTGHTALSLVIIIITYTYVCIDYIYIIYMLFLEIFVSV